MENYFIIHGSFGSPFGNWFSWLQDFIATDGKQVYVPDFPIGVGYQNYENWSKLLKFYLDLGLINEYDKFSVPDARIKNFEFSIPTELNMYFDIKKLSHG